jgi:hypothetical protein
MVFFFNIQDFKDPPASPAVRELLSVFKSGQYLIYMGKDRFENDVLLKTASHPEDIWFHVEGISSAHVYLKQLSSRKRGAPAEKLTENALVVTALAQLVKMNSIEGCKSGCVDVVYCKVGNLQSASGGDKSAGLVHIKNESACSFVKGVRSEKEVEKLFKKCKFEPHDGLQQLQRFKSDREREDIRLAQQLEKDKVLRMKEELRQAKIEADIRNYAAFDKAEKTCNKYLGVDGSIEQCKAAEEDFM